MNLLEGIVGAASFSPDGRHRLWLERRLASHPPDWPFALFVGHNPSDAGADRDDMTARKCWEFAARQMKAARIIVANLGTLVCTDPAALPADGLAHPDNAAILRALCASAAAVVVAHGTPVRALHGEALALRGLLLELDRTPRCLGTTGDGWPRHPSRLGYDTTLVDYRLS